LSVWARAFLRVMNLITAVCMVVAAVIALAAVADWIGDIGWGYPWYTPAFLAVGALGALALRRFAHVLIKIVESE